MSSLSYLNQPKYFELKVELLFWLFKNTNQVPELSEFGFSGEKADQTQKSYAKPLG
mgnify:CR=1 FL=1